MINKNFRYIWISQIFSQVTVNLMNFLLLSKLFNETGSAIATSLLWVAFALPTIFLGPIGAASVDLIDRRKTLIVTNLLQSVIVLIYFFTHQHSLFLLYFIVFIYSLLNQFYVPAENAALPALVPEAKLVKANSLFFITQQASVLIGFGVAGILEQLIGFNNVLIVCSIFLFFAFISVTFLPKMKPDREIPKKVEDVIVTFFRSIWEGYVFIKDEKAVLYPLLILLSVQTAFAIVVSNLPILGISILGVPLSFSGLSIVVPAGVGALLGAYKINQMVKSKVRKKTMVENGLLIAGISILLLAFCVPYLPFVLRILLGAIVIILIGFGFVNANIPTITFLQENTPDEIRGRVFGNLWFFVSIVTIFPVLFSGVITELLGIKFLLAIVGIMGTYLGYYMKVNAQRIISEKF